LMSTDGPYHNVLKIKPPMCFSKDNVDFLIENLDVVLSENFINY
jgi:4-aminobutyrate aminotransferase-like enzyme